MSQTPRAADGGPRTELAQRQVLFLCGRASSSPTPSAAAAAASEAFPGAIVVVARDAVADLAPDAADYAAKCPGEAGPVLADAVRLAIAAAPPDARSFVVLGWPLTVAEAGAVPLVAPPGASVCCATADEAERAEWAEPLERMLLAPDCCLRGLFGSAAAIRAAAYAYRAPGQSRVLETLPTPRGFEALAAHPFGSSSWPRLQPLAEACALVVLARLCGSRASYRAFVGTNPVALRPERVAQLARREYAVSPKIHGERWLLLASGDRWLAFDRSARVSVASRPGGARPDDESTVLDAERRGEHLFVLDVLRVGARLVTQLDLPDRLTAARDLVFGGHLRLSRVAIAGFQDYRVAAASTVRELARWVEHPERRELYDGIVFTPVRRPYHLGRCDQLLKWKPRVTADLWWNGPGDARLYARSDAADSVAIQVGILFDASAAGPDAQAGVYEAVLAGGRSWTLLGRRRDKTEPNALSIVEDTIRTSESDFTADKLCAALAESEQQQQQQESSVRQRR